MSLPRPWRLLLGAAALACIAAGAFQPFYWRMFHADRASLGRWLAERPYSKMPGLRTFMAGVRERTPEGSSIAIALPAREWENGYAYGFIRSTYLLAGRRTVPLVSEGDAPLPDNLRHANWIAAWRTAPQVPGFVPVWSTPEGVLLRRSR